ncbi:MAG: hypothetical protein ACRECX_08505 [Methyloceanibacter sp.]|uniref:hypothetical protein n=1 Tax=Methyloceanibacter sp. TaxID=1965321 RepID=UPI003D6CE05E
MATILEFRRSEEAARTKPPEGSLGEIIIFPGVRIERRASGDTPDRQDRRPGGGRRAQGRNRARKN